MAAGAGKYLVVWSEQPFDSFDIAIHAGRLDAAGASLDPTPALIAANGYVVDVGFNGTDFVVLWLFQQPSNAYSLRLTRISPTGVVKDPSGIELNAAVGGALMACAATDCLVAWTLSNWTVPAPPPGTYATRVAENGTMLDTPPIQLLPTASVWMLEAAGSGYVMQYSSPDQSGGTLLQKLDATGTLSARS